MTNFDYLAAIPAFKSFADTAIAAERTFAIDPATSVVNARRTLEFAVRWLYSVDKSLPMPWQNQLGTLLSTIEFRKLIGNDNYQRIEYIRRLGNSAAHSGKKITPEQAELALQNLFIFLDFIAYCYAPEYRERTFNPELLKAEPQLAPAIQNDEQLSDLKKEPDTITAEFSQRRAERKDSYTPKPLEISEYLTRKIYIDTDLSLLGWTKNKDWLDEYELTGMPNASGVGYADYVLFDDDGVPLALIEAKKTCKDVSVGRQQAKLYADLLEKKFGRRPVIFLSNGFDTRIIDGTYPERKVSGFYAKRDLQKLFNLRTGRMPLTSLKINDSISGRYYQKDAVRAVCSALGDNRRKALLVMATGSGKTRTVISLVDVLLKHKWVKNVLFLADRTALVTQAKRSFTSLLPDLPLTNLCEANFDKTARVVFSTYQSMENAIDNVKDETGSRLFSCGHFDLIVVDEAHRSIYRKYQNIFTYFDAFLVGLTATPKEEIDRNTYGVFELEDKIPTYGYDLSQAVKDGYLVDYLSIETKLKFIEKGVAYDDLSPEEQEEYERLFADEDGNIPTSINAAAINRWLFNTDTIKKVLDIVMKNAIHVDYGSKIGKTIIFAANHQHAEKIYEIFGQQYPNYPADFCRVIDNYTNYAQSLIDEFSDNRKLPQIAVSVDMLDTGIDVPEVTNLVFFKKVYSKAKFWQMIGRGTRLSPGLLDGKDKENFYIFDFCGNFEFFRHNHNGRDASPAETLQARIFNLKNLLIYKMQGAFFKDDEQIKLRNQLIDDVTKKVKELNRENFAVRQHLKWVDSYSRKEAFTAITFEITQDLATHVSPLILPETDDVDAVYFDYLLHGLEYTQLAGQNPQRLIREVVRRTSDVSRVSTIPEVRAKLPLLQRAADPDYLRRADLETYEHIRTELRDLMKYIPLDRRMPVFTDFADESGDSEWHPSEGGGEYLTSYREKAEHYLKTHENTPVIQKLKTNLPLTADDIKELETILWNDVGTKQDYSKEIGGKQLGIFVREIIGLDMQAAKDAFAKYIDFANLNQNQSYFVNKVIEYIVKNGMLTENAVMMNAPFTDRGTVADIFGQSLDVWNNILIAIAGINKNAETS